MDEIEKEFWSMSSVYRNLNEIDYEKIQNAIKRADDMFEKLFYQTETKRPYFWVHCSAKTYRETCDDRLKKFMSGIQEKSMLDFFKQEYLITQDYREHFHGNGLDFISLYNRDLCLEEDGKKRRFILEKLKMLGAIPVIREYSDEGEYGRRRQIYHLQEWEYFDVLPTRSNHSKTNKNQLVLNQKILLLNLLGALERLPRNNDGELNKSLTSKVLSRLIGHDSENIRKALANLEKKPSELSTKQKNDVEEVNKVLKELGCFLG